MDEVTEEAIEAALGAIQHLPTVENKSRRRTVAAVLEAAYPIMLSHERKQTRLADQDAMVNRDTAEAQEKALEAILALHRPGEYLPSRFFGCTVCRGYDALGGGVMPLAYPCPTVQVIQRLQEGEA
jgi:hypothetical protein